MSSRSVSPRPVQDDLACRPTLVAHKRVQEQSIRNRRWAIVQNTISGSFMRIDVGLWHALTQLQGDCSLRDWLLRHESQYGRVSLLESVAHLQRNGLLLGMPAGPAKTMASGRKMINPLMLKLPLCNPSSMLSQLSRYSQVLSGRCVVLLMLALFSMAIVIALFNTEQLFLDWKRVLSEPENWWQYLLLYPCLKCLHELSHGLVLKRLGGNVREAGISLLVLMPVPYVNATDVWSLPRRRDRLAVTAAGMLCDLTLASFALLVWYTVQTSLISDLAFSIMVMGFISVFMFNANPLLKFDGYYLLEDLLDSPGLARRSLAYWQYLFKRYVFGGSNVVRPLVEDAERRFLLPYGFASLLYRMIISIVISVFLISRFHEIGLLLAAFSIVPMFVRPLPRLAIYLASSAQLQGKRLRATARLVSLFLLVALPIMLLPLPSSTRAEGIVWSPEQSEIFVPESGEIAQWFIQDGESVVAGQELLRILSPELEMEAKREESQIALLMLDYAAQRHRAPERAVSTRVEIERRRENLTALQDRMASLRVLAPREGRIALPLDRALSGQRVLQGQLLMYLVGEEPLVVRAVVNQRQLGQLQTGVTQVQVRFVDDISTVLPARLDRQLPVGNNRLPSLALANNGFGGIDVQAGTGEMQTVEEVFHLELILIDKINARDRGGLGGRAFITLRHAPETLGARWWRGSRQLFLKHLRA